MVKTTTSWKHIERLREQQHMSLYELAKKAGIPKNTLGNYRYKGSEISLINAKKIANALHVSMNELSDF